MTLEGESKLYKHPQAKTLYLTIPADIATDSQFTFKSGDRVKLVFDPKTKSMTIIEKQ